MPTSRVTERLACFGPNEVPIWSDLAHVNRFCKRCNEIDWFAAQTLASIADGYSFYPKVPLYECYPTIGEVKTSAYRASIGVDPIGTGLDSINNSTSVAVDCQAMPRPKPPYTFLTITLEDKDNCVSRWLEIDMPISSNEAGAKSSSTTVWGGITSISSAGDIARYWLQDCINGHAERKTGQEHPVLPRRIVDVSSRSLPFLCEPGGNRAQYACLSYCWGTSSNFQTTLATLEANSATLPVKDMPRTLQDAIWWTKQLGLQYIWIDALCIVQDSTLDKDVDLTQMADIYNSSTIVIAATASRDTMQGCLPSPNKLNLVPCTPVKGLMIQTDYSRDKWIYERGPLECRAWTFQEVQLGPRVLRCGGEEIVWQCQHCKRRESDPTAMKVHDSQDTGTFFGTRVIDDVKRLSSLRTADGLWYSLSRQFSKRDISFSEDRLPAFSGMAKHFANIFDRLLTMNDSKFGKSPRTTYLAGLFSHNLPQGLCWRTLYPSPRIPYRAPSWSWASISSLISHNFTALEIRTHFTVEVIAANAVITGLNSYGKVSSGKLVLVGPVAPIPSHVYGDESEALEGWNWCSPLLTWDVNEERSLGCVALRLTEASCLLLEPVISGERHAHGAVMAYRRVGMMLTPSELEDPDKMKVKILDELEWREEVVVII